MTTAPARTPADEFPIRQVRFVGGRTWHRTRRPVDERWWDLLEAACGKSGYKTDAYVFGKVRECRGCQRVVEPD